LAKALSKGFGPQHIRVNTVDPRPVATDFWAGCDGVASVLGDATGKSAEQVTEEFASTSITGRFTRPDEVADLLMMLAKIDGGWSPHSDMRSGTKCHSAVDADGLCGDEAAVVGEQKHAE
jgi:NAD(P)-dependent dehydrogenase (short-subunit alcohol dehydrogenase family)